MKDGRGMEEAKLSTDRAGSDEVFCFEMLLWSCLASPLRAQVYLDCNQPELSAE